MVKRPEKDVLESPRVLKELVSAHRHLATLNGRFPVLPNEKIFLSNLYLQEAKDSSAIENIITTQDSLYKQQVLPEATSRNNKEVYNYSKALEFGFNKVKSEQGISCNLIISIQKIIDSKRPGFRKVPGTVVKNQATNKVIYTPPTPDKISKLMHHLEDFINSNSMDPILKMAIIHHEFESIHPFYDGNGRTGRILNILYLVLSGLLESPILYLSRYINNTKPEYYRHLQSVRDQDSWEEWIIYMIKAVSVSSQEAIALITDIFKLFKEYKEKIRKQHKFYSHDLINHIFAFPYTTSSRLQQELQVSRATSKRYLEALSEDSILEKVMLGRKTLYLNTRLFDFLKKY